MNRASRQTHHVVRGHDSQSRHGTCRPTSRLQRRHRRRSERSCHPHGSARTAEGGVSRTRKASRHPVAESRSRAGSRVGQCRRSMKPSPTLQMPCSRAVGLLVHIASVALDTDRTSWYSMGHRLIDRGTVCCRLDGRELTIFQRCVDPELPKPSDVQQVHGITDRVVQGQSTIAHVSPPFSESLALPTLFSWPIPHDSTSVAIEERYAITIVYERGSP